MIDNNHIILIVLLIVCCLILLCTTVYYMTKYKRCKHILPWTNKQIEIAKNIIHNMMLPKNKDINIKVPDELLYGVVSEISSKVQFDDFNNNNIMYKKYLIQNTESIGKPGQWHSYIKQLVSAELPVLKSCIKCVVDSAEQKYYPGDFLNKHVEEVLQEFGKLCKC